MNKRLCKSNRNRTIFGVCGGIGEYFNVDPTLIRIGFIAFGIFGGSGLLLYLACALIMPNEYQRGFPYLFSAREFLWGSGDVG